MLYFDEKTALAPFNLAHPVQYVFTVADKEIQANGADVLTIYIPILYSLTSLSVLLAENPLGVWTNAVSSPSAFGHIPVTAWFLLQLRQYLRSCFVHCLWICATYYCAGPITVNVIVSANFCHASARQC